MSFLAPTGLGGTPAELSIPLTWTAPSSVTCGLLLHMDSNGASHTQVDSSGNNLTTNCDQIFVGPVDVFDSGAGKFGAGAALLGGNAATGAEPSIFTYTSIAQNGPIDVLSGTGDFTVEMFFKSLDTGSVGNAVLFGLGTDANGDLTNPDPMLAVVAINSGAGGSPNTISMSAYNYTSQSGINGIATITAGVYYHVALTRESGYYKLWFGGALMGVPALARTYTYPVGHPTYLTLGWDGQSYSGGGYAGAYSVLIDEVRITKGTALYTSPFTPPTAEFPDGGTPYGYEVFRNSLSIATFAGTPGYTDTVPGDGTYTYNVAAWDGSADDSPESAPFIVSLSSGIHVYGKLATVSAFPPIVFVSEGRIEPRVWMPKENVTVRP